jgi:hypothetical protein
MNTEMNLEVVDSPVASLSYDRVTECLNDALRLFAEGDSEKACLCLAEANRLLDLFLAEQEAECGVTPISVASSIPPQSAEREEEAALATA